MRWEVAKPTLQPSSSLSCAFLYLHELPPSMSTNHCVNLGRLLTCSVFQLFLKNSQILRNSPIGKQDIAYVCLCLCACICFLKENRSRVECEWIGRLFSPVSVSAPTMLCIGCSGPQEHPICAS